MSNLADFRNAVDVRYGTTKTWMVKLGTTRVWPHPTPPPVYNLTTAETATVVAAVQYYLSTFGEYYSDNKKKMPVIYLTPGQGVFLPDDRRWSGYDMRSSWVGNLNDDNFYGRGDPSVTEADGSFQARYGGDWYMPLTAHVGDEAWIYYGPDPNAGAGLKMAKIVIIDFPDPPKPSP